MPDPEAQPDDWEVETVVNHEWRGHIPFFQFKWKGFPDLYWEPANHFFHSYGTPVIGYCASKGISLDVIPFLRRQPH